jgi:hypothetical protein
MTGEKHSKREEIERSRFLQFTRSMYYDGNKFSVLERACSFFELLGYDRNQMYLDFLISVSGRLTADIVIGPERSLGGAFIASAIFPTCSKEIWAYVKQAYQERIPEDVTLVLFSPSRVGIFDTSSDFLYNLRRSSDEDIFTIYDKLCYWNRI